MTWIEFLLLQLLWAGIGMFGIYLLDEYLERRG